MSWKWRRSILCGCLAAFLCANRAPPLWQGTIERRSFNASVQCVRGTLAKFGVASVSWGAEPEYGDARVFLRARGSSMPPSPLFRGVRGAAHSNPRLMVALTRAPNAVFIYMDAETRKSSKQLWRSVVRRCGVHDLGN